MSLTPMVAVPIRIPTGRDPEDIVAAVGITLWGPLVGDPTSVFIAVDTSGEISDMELLDVLSKLRRHYIGQLQAEARS